MPLRAGRTHAISAVPAIDDAAQQGLRLVTRRASRLVLPGEDGVRLVPEILRDDCRVLVRKSLATVRDQADLLRVVQDFVQIRLVPFSTTESSASGRWPGFGFVTGGIQLGSELGGGLERDELFEDAAHQGGLFWNHDQPLVESCKPQNWRATARSTAPLSCVVHGHLSAKHARLAV